MNWVKSGKEKSVKLVEVHDAIGRERVIRADGGTLNPTKLLVLGVFCNTKPHWALHISSAKIASRDHSRANWAQSVMRSDAHCAWKKNIRYYSRVMQLGGSEKFTANTYAFICAHTRSAWWWEGRLANSYLATADLASLDNVLSPGVQIDLWHCVAWNAWISEKNTIIISPLLHSIHALRISYL